MLSFPWDQFLRFRLCTVMPDISKDIQTYPDISKNIQNLKIQTYPKHIQICEYSPVIVICTIIVFRRSLTTISNRKYQVCLVTYARLPLSCIGYIIFSWVIIWWEFNVLSCHFGWFFSHPESSWPIRNLIHFLKHKEKLKSLPSYLGSIVHLPVVSG